MDDRIIKKYVKDYDGLISELTNAPFVWQPQFEIGEQAVVFLFAMIFKYLKFKDISIGHLKDLENKLDATALLEDGEELWVDIEFESRSSHAKNDIRKVKPEEYSKTLIVCWDDNWRTRPSEIDVFDIEPLWKKAQEKAT
ncbi:MAG: hypothetical protein WCD81_11470 [Candidatus Bathyarchaeia archaeon]